MQSEARATSPIPLAIRSKNRQVNAGHWQKVQIVIAAAKKSRARYASRERCRSENGGRARELATESSAFNKMFRGKNFR